jgi:cellulose synthase/poly-beta-1,6-N-acetylglucosamine synthase-like glycosyltransferase
MTQLFAVPNLGLSVGSALIGIGAAGIFYAYLGYPLVLWMISRFRSAKPCIPSDELSLSMVIAAHNEGTNIRKKLEETLALDYPREKLQIIVASDGSTDGTNDIVREFAEQGVELVAVEDRLGKTNAQNVAARQARNSILVFSDATTIYDSKALRYFAGAYRDPRVGAASGRYDYFDPTAGSAAGSGSAVFWNLENWIKRMQWRIDSLSGCCGCIYSVRRDLYSELPPEIISDLVQPLHVLLKQHRVCFQEGAQAWEETTRTAGEEFSMRIRVATRGMRGLLSVPSLLAPWSHPWIAFQLWSHKIVRWCIPIFLLLVLVGCGLLISEPIFRYLLLLQLAFYSFALASMLVPSMKRSRVLSLPLYFCTINTAFLLGMCYVIRGRQYNVWQPLRR